MNRSAALQLTLAMAIFGSVGFFSQHAGLPAVELVFVRCVCALLFLAGAWFATGTFRRERWTRKETLLILACGATNLLNWVFLFRSFQLVSVTIAISLYHLAPIVVLLAGSFLFRDKLSARAIFAIAGCFAGTILILGTDGFRTAGADGKGMLYGVLAALFYAATMLLGKSVRRTSVYATTMLQMGVGLLLLLPFVHYGAYGGLNAREWTYAVVTGVLHTGFVYLLFFRSIRHLPSAAVSLLVFVDPAIAILLDIGVTGFRPNVPQTTGIVLLFGCLFAALFAPLSRGNKRA